MEIRQLEYFRAVCGLNSISKAAEQLHVAQPSVSIAIQKLEEELGVMLFDRTQRQISLTEEGKIFSQRVSDILLQIGDSVNEIKDLRFCQSGTIKIGIPPMIGVFLFPHIFARFRKRYPDIKLIAVEAGSLSIQKLLEDGNIDVGIITQNSSCSALDVQPITSVQIRVCLPQDHSLSGLASIPFAKLEGEPFILFKEDTYSREIIVKECRKHNFKPDIVFVSSQIDTIISLVELGVGISFLFDVIAKKHSAINCLPLEESLTAPIVLAWNRKRYLNSASRIFIEFINSIKPNF